MTMDSALLVSNVFLWVIVVVMAIVIMALTRQIGVLHERIAPAGALMVGKGIEAGDPAPQLSLQDLNGGELDIGGVRDRSMLLFFLSPTCPVCDTLIPVLRSVAKSEKTWLDIVFSSDGDIQEQKNFIKTKNLEQFPYVLSTELGMVLGVGKLPFTVLIDEKGIVRTKGLVNSREHLESMFEANERGVASLQEYLEKQKRKNVA